MFSALLGCGEEEANQEQQAKLQLNTLLESIKTEGIKGSKFNRDKLDRLYRYPANYQQALIHKRATKYGYSNKKLRTEEDVPICPDCQNYPSTIDIELCYHTHPSTPKQMQEVFLLHSGVSMYFTFIKMAIMYLLMRFLIVDAYTTLASLHGQYCTIYAATHTVQLCTFSVSAYNLKSSQDQSYLNIIDILNLILTIVSIIYFTICRKITYKLQYWLDYNITSQQDFSVLLDNIPIIFTKAGGDMQLQLQLKNQIESTISQWFPKLDKITKEEELNFDLDKDFWKFVYNKNKSQVLNSEIVTGVTLCYDLTELQNIKHARKEFINRHITECSKFQTEQDLKDSALRPNMVEMINHEYLNTCYKYAMDQSTSFILSHFTGKAFVSFQYQHYRDYFLREYSYNKHFLTINQNPIRIRASSKPEDIYWKNMKTKHWQRRKYICYSYIILAMTLILSFAALLGLDLLRLSTVITSSNYAASLGGRFIVILMTFLTIIINYVLTMATYILSDRQGHPTKNQRLRHLVIKTILAQGINTVLLYFILNAFNPTNPLSSIGIVTKVMYLVVISGSFNVIWYAILPMQLISNLINSYKYSRDKFINLFQFQLNRTMQFTQFDFAPTYAFYIVYAYIACFYGIMTPLASPALVLIFFLQYWVDKYNLFRRNSYPNDLGARINRLIFKSFQLCIFFTAIGHIVWDGVIHYDVEVSFRVISIVNLCLSTIYTGVVFLAPQSIVNKLFKENMKYQHHQYRYYLDKGRFRKTYYRQNPATSCLKQVKISQTKSSNNIYVKEVLEPKLIEESQFSRYIQLSNIDTKIDKYDHAEVQFYQNIDNANWDDVATELVRNVIFDKLLAEKEPEQICNNNTPMVNRLVWQWQKHQICVTQP